MSRYIDADALTKRVEDSNKSAGLHLEDLRKIRRWIKTAPSIDIVRCAECKYNYNTSINHGKMQPRCDFTDWKLSENDYCSRGERKESE